MFPSLVSAAEAPGIDSPDLFVAGLKMVGALALVVGGLLLLLYFLRRMSSGKSDMSAGRRLIQVLGTKALAPKQYIALVEVGGSVLTLGVTSESITCLDKTSAETIKALLEERRSPKPEIGFAQRLKALTGHGGSEEKHS